MHNDRIKMACERQCVRGFEKYPEVEQWLCKTQQLFPCATFLFSKILTVVMADEMLYRTCCV
jgi:hypothetical protein